MSTMTLELECCCGARLRLTADAVYSSRFEREREAFDQAHAVCRQTQPDRPDDPAYVEIRNLCDPEPQRLEVKGD